MTLPIYIMSGFLGVGKTTFINRLLADHPKIKFGLVVNELGEATIESGINSHPPGQLRSLPLLVM